MLNLEALDQHNQRAVTDLPATLTLLATGYSIKGIKSSLTETQRLTIGALEEHLAANFGCRTAALPTPAPVKGALCTVTGEPEKLKIVSISNSADGNWIRYVLGYARQ
jgi:hypothetical protein